MASVILPPELERFAAEAVAQGRYGDLSEVVRAGVSLLQRAEVERAAFLAEIEAAQQEGERCGFFAMEAVGQELDSIIDAAERRGA